MAVRFHLVCGFVGLAMVLALPSCLPRASQGTVRVGVDDSPPFYAIHPDGRVDGFAVDILSEAARRRGIHLVWVPVKDRSLDTALFHGQVDIWPLVASTPERRRYLFFSDPWMENSYVLVSLRSRPIRDAAEARGLAIAHARLNGVTALAREHFPMSRLQVKASRSDAIQSVCRSESAAALVESRNLDAFLLTRPEGCGNSSFVISIVRGAAIPLSIVAVPTAKQAAIDLRAEISRLAEDGFLSAKLDQWTPISAQGSRYFWKARAAERLTSAYRAGFLCIVALALTLALVTRHSSRLRRKAEKAEANLKEVERRFAAFMNNSPAVSFMKDQQGRLLYVNDSFLRSLGGTREDWYGKDDFALWPYELARKLRGDELAIMEGSCSRQTVEIAPDATGAMRHWLTVKFPFTDETGALMVGGTAIDVTESETARRDVEASEERYRELSRSQQDTLAQLESSEQRWQLALSGAGDALWDWDLATGVIFRSTTWKSMLGYEDWEIAAGADWAAILHTEDADRVHAAVEKHLRRETSSYSSEHRLRHKDGSWRWILDRGQAVWDLQGNPTRMAGSHADITERKNTEQALALESATDPLTGLFNRREFDRAYAILVETAWRNGESLTVCVCDLDHFKSVNDSYGHAAGDRALNMFGKLLRKHLRNNDLVGRVGGDEFVIALPKASKSQAGILMDRIRDELQVLSCDTEGGATFSLSCSFGVAQLEERHAGPAALLAAADRSLYQAKNLGRNRSCVA